MKLTTECLQNIENYGGFYYISKINSYFLILVLLCITVHLESLELFAPK